MTTLTGTYQLPDGTPAAGHVEIIPSEKKILDADGKVILSGRAKVKLDAAGHFSVDLPATDDPTLNPTGFGYTLVAKMNHTHLRPVSFSLPAEPATVDIVDLDTVDPASFTPGVTYATGTDLADVADRVAELEAAPAPVTSWSELEGKPTTFKPDVTDPDLSARFVRGAAEDGAGTYTDGNVIRIGDHAYTPAGIATAAVIGGATNYENVIGGNPANVNTATSNLTGAAALTGGNGNWSFIHGGYDNVVNGWACSVMGFHCKVIAGANHITVSGGSLHTVNADAAYGTIGGGTGHTVSASSSGATIGGGRTNTASGQDSTVAGGQQNQATANSSTVAGGLQNTATSQSATVGGGYDNDATGNSSTVSGGLSNVASATGATVTGGRENTAAGEYSRAGGRGAVASNAGEDVFASTAFATAGDAQAIRIVLKRQTTNATASDLHNPGSLPPTIPENTTWAFTALVVARRADVDGENAAWEVKGLYKRDAGNTAALVGTPTVTSLGANAGNTWTLAVASYSVGNLRFVVTGEAAKTIRWVANTQLVAAAG